MKSATLLIIVSSLLYFQGPTNVIAQAPAVFFFGLNIISPQSGFLGIQFNGDVATECDPTAITLYSSSSSLESTSITLSSGASCSYIMPDFQSGLQVLLQPADVQAILNFQDLCTSTDNCYYTVSETFVSSLDTSPITPVDEPTQVNDLLVPSASITVLFSSLDLNAGELSITCDETIANINVSSITIDKGGSDFTFKLSSPASFTPSGSVNNATIPISDADISEFNQVVENPPSTNWTITFPNGAILAESQAVNNLTQLSLTVIRDGVSPIFQSFSLDMNTGILMVTFNELMSSTATTSLMFLTPTPTIPSLHNITLDGSNVTISEDKLSFEIVFNEDLFIDIQADTEIAKTELNTYLYLSPQSFFDVSSNPLAMETEAKQVTSLFLENEPPNLLSFVVTMDEGTIRMQFSEPMSTTSLLLDQITLIVTPSYLLSLTSDESFMFSESNSVLVIDLSSSSLNELKLLFFNSGINSLGMALTSNTITDTSGNQITAISLTNALPALSILFDTMHPTAAVFNVVPRPPAEYALNFTFNEYMNVSSFDISTLTLVLDTGIIGSREYTGFSGGNVIVNGYTVITYELSTADLAMTNILEFYQMAYYSGNMSVYYSTDFITDLASNIIDSPLPSNPTLFQSMESDSVSPQLESFSLNLVAGTVQINFTEAVVVLGAPGSIRIIDAVPTPSVTLTINSTSYADISLTGKQSFTLSLQSSDLAFLLADDSIATDISNTYMFMQSGFGVDLSGNNVELSDGAVQASEVIVPVVTTTVSSILQTSSSMATSSVPVASSSVPATSSSIPVTSSSVPVPSSSIPVPSSSVPVTSSSVPVTSSSVPVASSSVPVTSSSVPVPSSSIPVPSSSVPVPSSSIPVTSSSVPVPSSSVPVSSSSVPVPSSSVPVPSSSVPVTSSSVPVPSSTVPVPSSSVPSSSIIVSSIAPSTSSPSTVTSSLPQVTSTGISSSIAATTSTTPTPSSVPSNITLTYSELNMNTAQLLLRFSDPIQSYTGQYGDFYVINDANDTVVLNLTQVGLIAQDALIIFINSGNLEYMKVLRVNSNWSVGISEGAIIDTALGEIQLQIVPISFLFPDETGPILTSFDIDLNIEQITLTYNEPLNQDSINTSKIYLTGTQVSSPEGYSMEGSVVKFTGYDTFSIQFSQSLLNQIKLDNTTATGEFTTFIFVERDQVEDTYGNTLSFDATQRVLNYQGDNTGPLINSYQLDLNSGTITVTFNEPINANTMNLTSSYISSNTGSDSSSVTLDGEVIGASNFNTIISLSIPGVLNDLKYVLIDSPLAYWSVSSSFVSDVSSNAINDTTTQSDFIVQDTEPPSVVSISASASSPEDASITFNFSEYMLLDSFDETQMSITIGNITFANFNGGTWTAISNISFEYEFSNNDLLKDAFGTEYIITVNSGQFSVNVGFTLASDLGANFVTVDSPLNYTATKTDFTPPTVTGFELDTDSGSMILTFSESVIIQTVPQGLQLQNRPSNPTIVYTLVSNYSSLMYGSTIELTLSANDRANLTNVTGFANTVDDTFLLPNAQLAIDYSGNSLSSGTDAIKAISVLTPFTPEPPAVLLSNELDLNMGQLRLHFDRKVLANVAKVEGISITDGDTLMVSLSNSIALNNNDNNTVITIVLSTTNLNSVKLFIATSQSTFNVSIQNNSIYNDDNIGNAEQSVSLSITANDETSPQVESFSLDMDNGVVVITFNEPMDNTTYNTSGMWLSGTFINEPSGYQLVNGEITATSDQSVTLTVEISIETLNMIKANVSVGTSIQNTYIIFTTGSFQDVFDNPLTATGTSLKVAQYIDDTTMVSLNAFSLDLNNGALSLTFNEPVDISSLNPAAIKLHNSGQTDSITIGNEFVIQDTGYNSVVSFTMATDTLNDVKALVGSSTQVYLSMPSTTVTDAAANTVTAIIDSSPILTLDITSDSIAPSLISVAAGDENDRTVTLTFDEFIQPSTWNGGSLSLIFNSSLSSNTYSDFTDGTVSQSVTNTITYSISDAKFKPLLSIHYQQAYYSGSIGVSFTSSLIQDIGGNSVTPPADPVYYKSGESDPVAPQLSGFDLDLDSSTLEITFSEAIVLEAIQNNIKFQNTASSPSKSFTLSSGSYSSQNGMYGTVITISLLSTDVLTLANDIALANFPNDTYMVVNPATGVDYSGNQITINNIGIQASSVMKLTGPVNPRVLSFDLDLDSDQLTLHFDTPVDVSTFVPSRVTLVNESTIGVDTLQIQLSNTTVIAQGIQTDFRILLSTSNIIDIKRHPLCYTVDNCFATFSLGVAVSEDDLASQAVTTPLQVALLHQDVTPPRFLSFPVFDLNTGFFAIVFSEPINGSSTDFTEIQFGNTKTNPSETVTLTDGYTSPDHVELDFHLTNDDLNQLKYHLNLCTKVSNCWLRLPSFVLSDIGSNPFLHSNYQPGADSSYHSPTVFVQDNTAPTLNEVFVNMHEGKITFVFNEVIDGDNFLPTDVTVLNEPSGELSLVLSNVTEFSVIGNGTVLEIQLTQSDLNWVKSRDMFSSVDDSYIALVTAMSDVSGNQFVDINTNEAKQATKFISDQILATLMSFELFNIDNGSFILSFDEPMNDSSFNPSSFNILSNTLGVPSYQLTGGSAVEVSKDKTLIMIVFSNSDRVAIKLISELATNDDDTYISLDSNAILDRSANPNNEVPPSSAIKLNSGKYIEDTSPAYLKSATIDMNQGLLTLSFDDVVNADELRPSFITIQNQSDILSGISYTLVESTVVSDNSDTVLVNISNTDTIALKTQLNLAKSTENTYISFTTSLGEDIEGRAILAVANTGAMQVVTYIRDKVSPEILSYDLDMDTGDMMMTFSEPVLLSSFTPAGFKVQNSLQETSSYTLQNQGNLVPKLDGAKADSQFTLELDAVDLNEVKSNIMVATKKADTYITLDPSFITDTSGNPINAVGGMNVGNYLADITLPSLVQSSLDMTNGGKLVLQFSEAVQYTENFLSSVRIQNSLFNPSQFILLVETGNSVTKTDLNEITVTLSNTNTNKILNDATIASSTSNAFVSLVTGGIFDYSQLGVGQSLPSITTRITYMYLTCFEQNTYNNIEKGTCETCSSVCVGGCTGAGSFIGEGGCGLCNVVQVDDDLNQVKCLAINGECPDTHYVDTSTVYTGLTSNGHLCRPCHEDCATCSGPGSSNCDSCQSALKLNGAVIVQCLTSCPQGSSDCSYCHSECNGCFGSGNTDCISCKGESQVNSDGQTVCVPSCNDDEYLAPISGEYICIPCHKECIGCTGPSNSDCKACQNFNNSIIAGLNECSPRCLFGTYADGNSKCQQCDPQCDGCTGPSSANCTTCVEDTLSVIGEQVCVPTCPLLQEYDIGDRQCTLSETGQVIVIAVCCSVGVIIIILVIVCACCCVCRSGKKFMGDSFGEFDLSKSSKSGTVSFVRSSRLFHPTSKL